MGLAQQVQLGPSVAASSANFFVTSVTPTSGTLLTLANTAPAIPRRVGIVAGSEAAQRTMVVTGTNAFGNPIQETVTIPASTAATYSTTQDFATVTSLLPLGGGWTAATTVGTTGVAGSPVMLVDRMLSPSIITFAVVVTGTINYTIEYTLDDPNSNANLMGGPLGNYPVVPAWFNGLITSPVGGGSWLAAQTASRDGTLTASIAAWRLTLNSGGTGSGDTVRARAIQTGPSWGVGAGL